MVTIIFVWNNNCLLAICRIDDVNIFLLTRDTFLNNIFEHCFLSFFIYKVLIMPLYRRSDLEECCNIYFFYLNIFIIFIIFISFFKHLILLLFSMYRFNDSGVYRSASVPNATDNNCWLNGSYIVHETSARVWKYKYFIRTLQCIYIIFYWSEINRIRHP